MAALTPDPFARCSQCNTNWLAGHAVCPACHGSLVPETARRVSGGSVAVAPAVAAAPTRSRSRRLAGTTPAPDVATERRSVDRGQSRPAAAASEPGGRAGSQVAREPALATGRSARPTAVATRGTSPVARTERFGSGVVRRRPYPFMFFGTLAVIALLGGLWRLVTPGDTPAPRAANAAGPSAGALVAEAPTAASGTSASATSSSAAAAASLRFGRASALVSAVPSGPAGLIVRLVAPLRPGGATRLPSPEAIDYLSYLIGQGREQEAVLGRIDAVLTEAEQSPSLSAIPAWKERFGAALLDVRRVADAIQQPRPAPAEFATFQRDYQAYGAKLAAFVDSALAAQAATDPVRAAALYTQTEQHLTALDPMLQQLQAQLDSVLAQYAP